MNNNQKTVLNFIIGLLSQVIILIIGLIIPRIILVNYGSDINGLISTVTQVFMYMSLLESGISIATKKVLYKPINENNTSLISYYLSISKRYYKKISIIYFISVLLLSFVLPLVISSNIEYWTIFAYVLFEGLVGVVSFYFINTWSCFLIVSGKNYIILIINFISKILVYGIKIVLLIFDYNIAFIQIGCFVVSLLQLVIYYLYMNKHYSWIDYNSAPLDAKLPDRYSFFINEISWTIFSSTDMIILSIFMSTSLSSIYSVYNMVFVALNGVLFTIYNAVNYNLGKDYSYDIEKYKKTHDLYNSIFMSLITILMSVAYILIIPFVKLYTSGVNDINYIYKGLPLLFCLVHLLSWSRYVSGNLSDISGYVKQTSYISVIEAVLNIVLSIVLVRFLGIIGVLLGTVIVLPIKVVYLTWLSDKKILKRSVFNTLKILFTNYLIFIVTLVINHFICFDISSYFEFLIYGAIIFFIYFILVFLLNSIVNKELIYLVKNLFRKRK